MKRFRLFSFIATLVVVATTSTSVLYAKVPDVYITYQTGGHTCWNPANPTTVAKGNYDWRSDVIYTKSVNDTNALGFFGTGWGDWATNRDGSQVNCLKINLFPSQTITTTKDFVLCGQAAEIKTSKSFFQSIFGGQSSKIQNIGTETCSDAISVTNGNFLKLTTSNNGTIGAVRFRIKSASFFGANDEVERTLRVSTQLQNENGTKGSIVSTAWSNLGFQDANVNQAGGHLNAIYFALEKNPDPIVGDACTPTITSKKITIVPGGESFQFITNPGNVSPTTGTSVKISKGSKWAAPITNTSWVSYKTTANQNGSGPAGGTQIAFTKTFVIEGVPQESTLLVMADDLLNVKINGNQVFDHQNAGQVLFTAPTSVTVPASVMNTGTNTIVFTVGQRNPDDNSAIGFNYSFDVNSTVTTPPTNPSCPVIPPPNNPTADPGTNPGTNGGTNNGGTNGGTGTTEQPATCTFAASKLTIIKGIDTSTLSWSCSNGGATANISGLGSVSKSGTRVVSPTADTTYTLTYGNVTQSITIKVNTPNVQEQ